VPSRTYRQHCSLAHALDLVGERWTLLLVRDLLAGPRRYKDLLKGLPGIGTNLLAARLKELERLGLIEGHPLKDRRGSAYALTDAGRELEEAVVALARFGARRLGPRSPENLWRATWTPLAMKATFRPAAARGVHETYEYRIDGEVFHARVDDGRLETANGPAQKANLVVETDGDTFLALASGELTPREALVSPAVRVHGDLETLERSHAIFGLPT